MYKIVLSVVDFKRAIIPTGAHITSPGPRDKQQPICGVGDVSQSATIREQKQSLLHQVLKSVYELCDSEIPVHMKVTHC